MAIMHKIKWSPEIRYCEVSRNDDTSEQKRTIVVVVVGKRRDILPFLRLSILHIAFLFFPLFSCIRRSLVSTAPFFGPSAFAFCLLGTTYAAYTALFCIFCSSLYSSILLLLYSPSSIPLLAFHCLHFMNCFAFTRKMRDHFPPFEFFDYFLHQFKGNKYGRTAAMPHACNPARPQCHTAAMTHGRNATWPQCRTAAMPHGRNDAWPHSRHGRTAACVSRHQLKWNAHARVTSNFSHRRNTPFMSRH